MYLERDVEGGVPRGIATNKHRAYRVSNYIDAGLILSSLIIHASVSPLVYCIRFLGRRLHVVLSCKVKDTSVKLEQTQREREERRRDTKGKLRVNGNVSNKTCRKPVISWELRTSLPRGRTP